MNEHAIQDAVRVELSKHGYKVWRINVGSGVTRSGTYFTTGVQKGFPDLFGYNPANGKVFFIEMKTPIGKPRPDQIIFHKQLMRDHIIHGIARNTAQALKIVACELIGYGYKDDK